MRAIFSCTWQEKRREERRDGCEREREREQSCLPPATPLLSDSLLPTLAPAASVRTYLPNTCQSRHEHHLSCHALDRRLLLLPQGCGRSGTAGRGTSGTRGNPSWQPMLTQRMAYTVLLKSMRSTSCTTRVLFIHFNESTMIRTPIQLPRTPLLGLYGVEVNI